MRQSFKGSRDLPDEISAPEPDRRVPAVGDGGASGAGREHGLRRAAGAAGAGGAAAARAGAGGGGERGDGDAGDGDAGARDLRRAAVAPDAGTARRGGRGGGLGRRTRSRTAAGWPRASRSCGSTRPRRSRRATRRGRSWPRPRRTCATPNAASRSPATSWLRPRRRRSCRQRALTRQQDLDARGVGSAAAVETAELAMSAATQAVLSRRAALAQAETRLDQAGPALDRRRIALAEAERRLADTEIGAEFAGVLSDVTRGGGRARLRQRADRARSWTPRRWRSCSGCRPRSMRGFWTKRGGSWGCRSPWRSTSWGRTSSPRARSAGKARRWAKG